MADQRVTSPALDVFGHTDTGRKRGSNQDHYLAVPLEMSGGTFWHLLAVADGMGGHAGGEVASEIAIRVLRQTVHAGLLADPAVSAGDLLNQAFVSINAAILRQAQEDDLPGMGTTLVAALVGGGHTWLGNIGDSRAYLIGERTLQRITSDHSWEEQRANREGLTPADIAASPFKGMLTRSLGGHPAPDMDLYEVELRAGDYLLLCSDGVHRELQERDILESFTEAREAEQICRRLIACANQCGGSDNITCVVARVVTAS